MYLKHLFCFSLNLFLLLFTVIACRVHLHFVFSIIQKSFAVLTEILIPGFLRI